MALAPLMLAPSAPVASAAAVPPDAARLEPDFIVKLADEAELAGCRDAWHDLAANALEPNCFYEPWMLLPALRHLAGDARIATALIFRREPQRSWKLCGLVPLERRRRWRGLPIHVLAAWKHLHCLLCAPLLHRDHARGALRAFLQWAGQDRCGASLIEFPLAPAEGPFAQLLTDVVNDLGLVSYASESFTRALLRPAASADAYFQGALAPKHRRELARMRRRLGELGRLELRRLEADDDPLTWLNLFLVLESAGWKGAEHTALNCRAGERDYFQAIVLEAQRRGQLMMLGLFLDDLPVALKCNFLAGRGAFTFKIAFDESFDKYSPGVQLELDNIRLAHAMPDLAWMDSCASADHPMINHLWTERRIMQNVLVSGGGWRGNLFLGILPLGRALKRVFWRGSRVRNAK